MSRRPGAPTPGAPSPGRPSGPYPGGGGYSPGGYGGPGGPRRTGRHPVSGNPMGGVRLEPAPAMPPTADPGRRHATRPQSRGPRKREIDPIEKLLPLQKKKEEDLLLAVGKDITISEGITVKELSEKIGLKSSAVIKKLFERKIFATINQALDARTAEEIAQSFGATTSQMSFEEETSFEIELAENTEDVMARAPVVTVMGHVDHGKTSLLDAIRAADVAAGEAGGITQHIGAYQVKLNERKIVFIDTPGHEAFTRMRARGAKVTDVVILVVAADDGVMPQTIEAIDHAKAANVPIVVAINKIDKPDASIDRIKQQLGDRGLLAEDWGGDVVMVPVSARKKENIDLLLENVLLVADLKNLRANPSRPGIGTVLEAQLDRGRGPVATVLVQNGSMRVGDYFICGAVFGKIRMMYDDRGHQVREAEPSTPVEILGLESLPDVGDAFQVTTDTMKAKQIVAYRENRAREIAQARTRLTLDQFHERLKEGETRDLNLIIKADVGGSAEVLADTLQKLSNEKVRIRVVLKGVGAITETDVLLASASSAIIIGFNVRPERNAVQTAETEKIDIRLHTIIYEVVDEMKKAMTGMLDPVYKEVFKGRADVRETFRITKVGTIAGCYVTEGVIARNSQVRLLRDNVVVHTGKIDALKRFKDDASEVKQNFECGMSLVGYQDIKVGDVIEAFINERVAPSLDA
jgi:translation initiation factor IF-2